MKGPVQVTQGVLIVGFLFFGWMKLSANPMQVDAFNDVYGYGITAMYVVGAVEMACAIGLLLGYWKKWIVPICSLILVLVMAGAIFTHFRAGQGFNEATTPLLLLLFSLIVLIGHKKLYKAPA